MNAKTEVDNVMRFWPIAAFLIAQTVGGVWWAATVNARVQTMEQKVVDLNSITEKLTAVSADVKNIQHTLDRVLDRQEGKSK